LLARDIAIAGTAGIRLHGARWRSVIAWSATRCLPRRARRCRCLRWDRGAAEHVAITGELLGALGDHVGDLAGPSPIEARVGAIAQLSPALAIGAHAGLGLGDQTRRAAVSRAARGRVGAARRPSRSARHAATPPSDDADDDPDAQ